MKRMLIERGAMGQKKEVKLEDIADSLGVSIVTVSNALKGKKGVSEGLRNRIKEAAQRMGYKTPVYEEKRKGEVSYYRGSGCRALCEGISVFLYGDISQSCTGDCQKGACDCSGGGYL